MIKIAQLFKNSFEGICHQLLVQGYRVIRTSGSCDKNWGEENISAHFADRMQKLPLAIKEQINVQYEVRIYTQGIINKGITAKSASRIDIYFYKTPWANPDYGNGYCIEAKNVSQTNRPNNASKQKTEYITKGINEFVQGNYPKGCMIAYVVQGKTAIIINDINDRIQKKTTCPSIVGVINKTKPILGFTEVYNSKCVTPSAPKGVLKHFFFDLT